MWCSWCLRVGVKPSSNGWCAASAGLKGKEKKAHDARKIEALGGKAAKARKTPYNILMGIKKKGAVREQRQKEEVRRRVVEEEVVVNRMARGLTHL